MRYPPLGLAWPMVVTFVLATGPALAQPRTTTAPASSPQSVAQGAVEGAPGARLAGYLNFCISNGLLPHGETMALLDHTIARSNAVFNDHRGDMDYAQGTAGILQPANPNGMRITDLDIPQRRGLCDQVRRKAAAAG
ncbi:hypothetical protein [Gluconacetobacter entanii]|nr:hypothetical protein [Gluconacetobacter entanii]MCE2578878.1 hypothetical protein [Komagataeibacter sp. FNDCR1]